MLGIKGFDMGMVDLVPGGLIQDLVRKSGAEGIRMLLDLGRKHYALREGEKMCYMLMDTNSGGKPCIALVPIAMRGKEMRYLPWINLDELFAKAPIAKYISEGKKAKKLLDKIEPLMKQQLAAVQAGDTDKAARLEAKVKALSDQMPALIRGFLLAPEKPAVAELPAAPVVAALPEHTAAVTGDTNATDNTEADGGND